MSSEAELEKRERVLIVEDGTDTREMLEALFGLHGFDVVAVADGPSAMAAWWAAVGEGRPFDVAVLDIALPLMDGFKIAGRIRSAERSAGVRVPCKLIGYTGYAESAEDMQTFEATKLDALVTKSRGEVGDLPVLAKRLLMGCAA